MTQNALLLAIPCHFLSYCYLDVLVGMLASLYVRVNILFLSPDLSYESSNARQSIEVIAP